MGRTQPLSEFDCRLIDEFHGRLAARYPDLDERERRWESTVTLEFTQAQTAEVPS